MTASNHNPAASAEVFDELDPHGFEKGHGHGANSHVIVGPFTLRTVLAFLLIFTALTVFLAQAELWAEGYFHISLPWWVNVAGAMSIAVVKALLVMAFFMQLKYSNPINTVLMFFCFAALTLFLFFSSLDLFNRGLIDEVKAGQTTPGGTGGTGANAEGVPMYQAAKIRMVARLKERLGSDEAAKAEFERLEASDHAAHAAMALVHEAHEDETLSTASRSRPRTGSSGALSTTGEAPKAGEHGER
jgi:cytochrome c oxidase subunit 4